MTLGAWSNRLLDLVWQGVALAPWAGVLVGHSPRKGMVFTLLIEYCSAEDLPSR